MSRFAVAVGAVAALFVPVVAQAQVKPLKIGYYTGGGYHNYKEQAAYIPVELEKLINCKVDVKWEREALRDPKLGEGYDVVMYNICWADDKDKDADILEKLPKLTFEGKPTVMIHCTFHSFRWVDSAWTECEGLKTRHHEEFQPFEMEKVEKNHPIIKLLPDDWKTPGDEPYISLKMYPNAVPLLNVKTKKGTVTTVAWVNQYGKGRVFGNSLGHDMKSIGMPEFMQLTANGTLWVCDKLGEDGKPKKGYGKK